MRSTYSHLEDIAKTPESRIVQTGEGPVCIEMILQEHEAKNTVKIVPLRLVHQPNLL